MSQTNETTPPPPIDRRELVERIVLPLTAWTDRGERLAGWEARCLLRLIVHYAGTEPVVWLDDVAAGRELFTGPEPVRRWADWLDRLGLVAIARDDSRPGQTGYEPQWAAIAAAAAEVI